jgi:hypothetical protein
MPGLDTTAGTMTPDEPTTTAETETETDPGVAGGGSGGCDCRAGVSRETWIVLLPISLLIGARRRRRVA